MVRAIRAFLEFCYIVRKNVIDTSDLDQLQDVLDRFHQYRQIFIDVGVQQNFNLPRQHSLVHFRRLIRAFGAPNGLCSSITESKHIKAVKEPWRRSSRYKATAQMLTTNSRLDKLAAMRADFVRRGMLPLPLASQSHRGNALNVMIFASIAYVIPSGAPSITRRKSQSINTSNPLAHDAAEGHDHDDDDVPGPRTMASVELAKVPTCTSTSKHHIIVIPNCPSFQLSM